MKLASKTGAKAAAQIVATPLAGTPARPVEELLHELQVHQLELEMQNEALRQSQLALEASRDRYARLYEFAPVGYLTLGDQGLIVEVNLTGATLLGVNRSKLISRRFAKFVAARDADRWHQLFLAALRPEGMRSDELLLQRDDGSAFQALIECRRAAVDDAAGEVLLTLTDISERMLLKQRKQSFDAIFERSPIGIGVAGPDRRYRQVNPALCRMLGYSEEELLGMTYLDVTHPDDRGLNTVNAESMVAGEVGHFSIEKRYVRKTGETVWVSLNAVAVAGENGGELLYSIGMAEDITARREAEIERLDSARQHRDTLVREVHHRIKNNLQSVAGLLQRELGRFVELDPRLATAISQVHAIAVVHGLQSAGPDEVIRLCDSVRSICKTVSDLAQRPVLLHIEDEQTSFRPVRIESSEAVPVALVLNELILNAVKHSPEGSREPTVSLSADGSSAQIVMRNALTAAPGFNIDTGEGLGTGLHLVRSLLPALGVKLAYELDTEGFMLTSLRLTSPVVATQDHQRQESA